MTRTLDLHDIQGAVLKAYGRHGFPKARFLLFRVTDGAAGRKFVKDLTPTITTSAPWRSHGAGVDRPRIPVVTTNIAFTYHGLRELGVPRASLQSFPDEFAMGMRGRRAILGDDGKSAPEHWDPVWRSEDTFHILVWINGQDDVVVKRRHEEILALVPAGGVGPCSGHRGPGKKELAYQEASAVYVDGQPTAREHFGYTDGISNPFFEGALSHEGNVVGGGKPTGESPETAAGWAPLQTGEFLLGHADEAGELPEAPIPSLLAMNGTFLVLRKLHENTASFDAYLERMAGKDGPFEAGREALAAKFAGRWRSGAPITTFQDESAAVQFGNEWQAAKLAIAKAEPGPDRDAAKLHFSKLNARFVGFDYNKDLEGGGCPVGAHVRRANPRGSLEFNRKGAFETPGAVDNRRRILRRGLPYGESQEDRSDEGDHGVMFMAINASIRRQFEFVQQQWITYGNDFNLANDRDPLVGNHATTAAGAPDGRMVLETGEGDPRPPFFCGGMPRFVETRGGGYFFIPGLDALRMIGAGTIDPT